MTMEERRNRTDLVELFKISKGLSAIPWNSFFRVDGSERTRGHSKKLLKKGSRLDIRKHFFSLRGLNRCGCKVACRSARESRAKPESKARSA